MGLVDLLLENEEPLGMQALDFACAAANDGFDEAFNTGEFDDFERAITARHGSDIATEIGDALLAVGYAFDDEDSDERMTSSDILQDESQEITQLRHLLFKYGLLDPKDFTWHKIDPQDTQNLGPDADDNEGDVTL